MNLTVKLELMKIWLRTLKETYPDNQADFSKLPDHLKMINTLSRDLGHYNQTRNMVIMNALNARKIDLNVKKIKDSWRWKIGHFLAACLETITFRRHQISVFDEINRCSEEVFNNYKLLKIQEKEPDGFLNPFFRLPLRNFLPGQKKNDSSVAIIINSKNGAGQLSGLSANDAVNRTDAEFILFLDHGIEFESDIIATFIRHFREVPTAGIIGARLLYTGAEAKRSMRAGIRFCIDPLYRGAGPGNSKNNVQKGLLRPCFSEKESGAVLEEFPAVSGAAMMIRRSDFIGLGGFDENYIQGYEDVDLCLRCLNNIDKKVILAGDITLIHHDSQEHNKRNPIHDTFLDHDLNVLLSKFGRKIRYKCMEDIRNKRNTWLVESSMNASWLNLTGISDPGADIEAICDMLRNAAEITRIAIKVPIPSNVESEKWGDHYFAMSLARSLEKKGYSVRIDLIPEWYDHGYLEDDATLVIRGLKRYYPQPGQLNIMWNISHPDLVSDEEYESYDHVFVASASHTETLSGRLSVSVSALYQCTDPDLFYPDPDPDPDIPYNSILYVSNSRKPLRKSIEYSLKNSIPVIVYGRNWQGNIPDQNIKGGPIPNDLLRKYYSRCEVLLNDHWADMSANGFISNRLFDAIASGCPILSDYCEGIETIFGDSVLVYSTEQEFVDGLKKMLNDPEKYKNNAGLWSQRIRDYHSFDQRAEEIHSFLQMKLSPQPLPGRTGKKA